MGPYHQVSGHTLSWVVGRRRSATMHLTHRENDRRNIGPEPSKCKLIDVGSIVDDHLSV